MCDKIKTVYYCDCEVLNSRMRSNKIMKWRTIEK